MGRKGSGGELQAEAISRWTASGKAPKSLWITARGRGSLRAMDRQTTLAFPKESQKPLPVIGVRRAMVQSLRHDDAGRAPEGLSAPRFALQSAEVAPRGSRRRGTGLRRSWGTGGNWRRWRHPFGSVEFFPGRGGRAGWQESPKALASLQQTTANAGGSP